MEMDVYARLGTQTLPILMYGMGNGAEKVLAALAAHGISVSDFFASDEFVRGQSFMGKKVLSYAAACEKYGDFAVVLGFGSDREEVLQRFAALDRVHGLYAPDVPVAGDEVFDGAFYKEHEAEYAAARAILADAASRAMFDDIMEYRRSGSVRPLLRTKRCHWSRDARMPRKVRCYADFGAYRGDTVAKMLEAYPGMETVFAMEPDARSFARLQQYCAGLSQSVQLACAAAWSEEGVLRFCGAGSRSASLQDASFALSHTEKATSVPALSADAFLAGAAPDFLKFDVEGAEHAALCGAEKTIRTHRPTLLVSAYHRPQDLYDLPRLISSFGVPYRFYLLRDRSVPAWDISYLCTAEENA